MKVNIYMASSVKSPRPHQNGIVGYVIEAETAKGPATLTQFGTVLDVTVNRAVLLGLKNALSRIKTQCDVIIYTDNFYIASVYAYGWIDEWLCHEWRDSRGELIANCEEWQQIVALLGSRAPVFEVDTDHTYRTWLESEVKKRAKAHGYLE